MEMEVDVTNENPSDNDDTMFGWGNSHFGQLGVASPTEDGIDSPKEISVLSKKNMTKISCGMQHSLFVTSSGELYSCGSNEHGQLGHNLSGYKPGIYLLKSWTQSIRV